MISRLMVKGGSDCSSNVCFLVAERASNMLLYLRDGSTHTILRAATLR